jgi:hypothetical protein
MRAAAAGPAGGGVIMPSPVGYLILFFLIRFCLDCHPAPICCTCVSGQRIGTQEAGAVHR